MTDNKEKTEQIPEKKEEQVHVHIPLYEKNSREEEAELALKRTKLTPAISWTLVIMLMLIIFSEPLIQISRELSRGEKPKVFEVVKLLPSFERTDKHGYKGFWRYWGTLATVGEIQDFEKGLEKSSDIGQSLLPGAQQLLTGTFKAGNEQAYIGVPGWLFYRPEVDYCTGKGFLDKDSLKSRSRSGDSSTAAIQPDPRIAILDLRDKLKARGIELIVMPAPIKPVIQPDKLSGRYSYDADAVQNPSYKQFVDEMTDKDIRVFEVTDDLIAQKSATREPQYLETDTHWTPDAMECAAKSLSKYIKKENLLPAIQSTEYERKVENITNFGDIAEMLKLPVYQKIYDKQTVTIHPVTIGNNPWQPDKSSDVLVLGDSFFNIYSLEGMGWGKEAGFVEQLSFQLQHPLDKIVINAGGSFATRKELDNRMKRGQDPLAGKKLVIYEFAMRDLMMGDWEIYPMVDKKKSVKTVAPVVPVPVPIPVPVPNNGNQTVISDKNIFEITKITPDAFEAINGNFASIICKVPVDCKLNLTIRDAANKDIRRLSKKNEAKKAGTFTVKWDGMYKKSKPVKPGKYSVYLEPVNDTALGMPPVIGYVTIKETTTVKPPVTPIVVNPPTVSKDLVISGTIKAISVSPKPGTVAYKDCVIAIDLGNVKVQSGTLSDSEILVFVWGMKDNKLTPASSYSVGQTVTFKLTAWDKVEGKFGGYNRVELNGDDIDALNLYWGEGR
ncbi:MAG: hypothetical protein WCO98_09930 [bacterium]